MYWWGIFDIIRRLFQTSVVVLVRIVDSRYDTVYAVLVSFVSVVLQVSAKRERMMNYARQGWHFTENCIKPRA
jgi:hypothetical protein